MINQLESKITPCNKDDHKPNRVASLFENSQNRKRPLWAVDEVASFLRVSPRTVRDWVYRRVIPYRKAGNSVRFCPEEIERWTLPTKE